MLCWKTRCFGDGDKAESGGQILLLPGFLMSRRGCAYFLPTFRFYNNQIKIMGKVYAFPPAHRRKKKENNVAGAMPDQNLHRNSRIHFFGICQIDKGSGNSVGNLVRMRGVYFLIHIFILSLPEAVFP